MTTTGLTPFQGKEVIPDPIGETVRNILTNMGLQVVDRAASCDATLSIITRVEPLSGSYLGGGSCYTGGNVDIKISLTASGQEAFETVLDEESLPSEQVLASWCDEHKRPEDFLEDSVFTDIWFEPLLDILADLWGPQILVWALDQKGAKGWPNLISRKLKAIGPTDEVVLALL